MNKYDEVIDACSGMVYMIIKKYFYNYDVEDIYQVGIIGIIKAYDNYKEGQNAKFSTYAFKYIYGEIYAYINKSRMIKVSKENATLLKKINEARSILSQHLMKEPNILELASFLEVEPDIISSVYNLSLGTESIDRVIYNDGKDITLKETIQDKKDYYDIDIMLLREELQNLPPEEKRIIYLRYYEDKTQSEVANILGKNQVSISRSEKKTLKKIQEHYQNAA